MVQAFTKASASVDGTRGGKFRLLDGNVLGVFTELVRNAESLGVLTVGRGVSVL